MSFTEQLQKAEKVTGELIILHDLLTWPKRRNTHVPTQPDTHADTRMHKRIHRYAQMYTDAHTNNCMRKHTHECAHTRSYKQTHIHTKKVRTEKQERGQTDKEMESEKLLKRDGANVRKPSVFSSRQ